MNKDVVVVPADKGCAIVVMDRNDYHDKIKNHLSDQSTYVSEPRDTTNSIRSSINQFLKKLFDKKLLTRSQYNNLFANSAMIPLFYALIKVHKTGYPIRPIVSFIGSPSYNIAKYLSKILTPSTNKSAIKLKNSIDIKQKLQSFTVPATHMLISFDVKALFTSIPQIFALDCLETFLEEHKDIYDRTRLNASEILKLIKLCFDSTLFAYDNLYYRQVTGTPMGSPVSVVIAEIVMQSIEKFIIPQIQGFTLFWYRYVDDVLACVKKEDVPCVLNIINSVNGSIQFTAEEEQENAISFLDLKLIKNQDGTLSFEIFRKATHTDKYLHYDSYHPIEHKNSVIRTLLHRANTLCDDENKLTEKDHIRKVLKNNSYPKAAIDKIENKRNNNVNTAQNLNKNSENIYVSLPYIKNTSERVGRILKKYDINIAHKPTRSLKSEICCLKDHRPVSDRAGVVYRFDCGDCDAVYVGETGRQVKDRMREHQRDVVTQKCVSKVYNHVNDTGHAFDFDNVRVLDNCSHSKVRLHLESMHTHMQSNPLNRSLTLNNIYHPLFDSRT